MNVAKRTFGNESDSDLRNSGLLPLISPCKVETLQELLTALEASPHHGMLRTTAGHISRFLNLRVDQLAIDNLLDLGAPFRFYLKEQRFTYHAVRSYSNFAAMLLREAKKLGWTPRRPLVPEDWQPIFAVMPKRSGCASIIRYAVQQNKAPSEFRDNDLHSWGMTFLAHGHTYRYMIATKNAFRHAVSRNGLTQKIGISVTTPEWRRYGIPLRSFPPRLRLEVEALLKWKQDIYAEGRPRRARLRPITAMHLEKFIGRLYGFVKNTQKRKNVKTLVDLITKESVTSFVKWCLNDRRLKSGPLCVHLGLLYASIRWNPAYNAHDFTWLRTLQYGIVPEPESQIRERKATKYLPYEVIADIPRLIHERRNEVSKKGNRPLALLVHDELLLSWLVTLVWRQRNIRECRLGTNLFKAEIPPLATIAKPHWVQESMRLNPRAQFWQFYFRESETKNGHEVRAILPRRLVPLLEEYLEYYRPLLLGTFDPGTLFLNRKGGTLRSADVTFIVSDLTLRYAQRRVTPHLVRDILAFWWLDSHPEDYLTLSKMLWHRNIKTTLWIYGCRFDESHGLRLHFTHASPAGNTIFR